MYTSNCLVLCLRVRVILLMRVIMVLLIHKYNCIDKYDYAYKSNSVCTYISTFAKTIFADCELNVQV